MWAIMDPIVYIFFPEFYFIICFLDLETPLWIIYDD